MTDSVMCIHLTLIKYYMFNVRTSNFDEVQSKTENIKEQRSRSLYGGLKKSRRTENITDD